MGTSEVEGRDTMRGQWFAIGEEEKNNVMKTGTPGSKSTSRRRSDLATRLIRTSLLRECRLPACLCSLERVSSVGDRVPSQDHGTRRKGRGQAGVEVSNQDG